MQVLSNADLYGGKICAALDRQHPRDFFDIKLLLDNDGINSEIRKAFIAYLIGHDRPINELLNPSLKNLEHVFNTEFIGMTTNQVTLAELYEARDHLLQYLKQNLTSDEKEFLLSFKAKTPRWELLGIPNLENLPAIKWKLLNLEKMQKKKHSEYLEKLKSILEA